MASFRDTGGKTWELRLDFAAVKRVKNLLGVNLLGMADPAKLGELLADLFRLVDVLYVLVKPQADAAGVSDEAFGAGLAGDALEQAAEAFVEALIDFFPQARIRAALKAVVAKAKQVRELALASLEEAVQAVDPGRALATWSASSTTPPASPGSTPTP